MYGATLGILVDLHVDVLMRDKLHLSVAIFEDSKHVGQCDFLSRVSDNSRKLTTQGCPHHRLYFNTPGR